MQTKLVHTGPVFSVEVLTWTDGQGRLVRRDIVRHPGAVLVLPLLDDGRLVMIRNHRVAVGRELLEFTAGKLEPNEPPAAAAARELIEETGYLALSIEPLGRFYTTPGFSDELMHVFVARGLSPVGQRLEAGEMIQVQLLQPEEALGLIDEGGIVDGKTIAGLLMWHRRQREDGVPVQKSDAGAAVARTKR